jgi:hypothetical protein
MIGSEKRDDSNEKKRRKIELDHFSHANDSILIYDEICYPIENN